MRRAYTLCVLLTLAAIAASGCGHARKPAETASAPPLLLDGRGIIMPFEKVMTHVSFRPVVPSQQVLAFAVLPPLGGADNNANRGVGIEYLAGHDAMLLSEWPKQQFNVAFKRGAMSMSPCTPAHYSAQAVAWTTSSNIVLTLQPDGDVPPGAVDREARRLTRPGACR